MVQSLSDEELKEVYQLAVQLRLEEAFIQLIRKEMKRRGIEISGNDSFDGMCREARSEYVWAS